MSVDEKLRQPLADAMGDEAWKTVKAAGHTPQKAVNGQAAPKGYYISGIVTNVLKEGARLHIISAFTLWVDGGLANIKPVPGESYAEGSMTAEDALRAVTEDRIKKLLGVIKTGTVVNPK